MKRLGAIVMTAVVAVSVAALAVGGTSTHDRALVALRQASQSDSEGPRLRPTETTERRQRAIRTNPRDQDQMLMLLLLLQMGSPASRR